MSFFSNFKNDNVFTEKMQGLAYINLLVQKMRFAIYLSGGFTTMVHSNKSTGKETGKTHLCALCWDGDQFVLRDYPKNFSTVKIYFTNCCTISK